MGIREDAVRQLQGLFHTRKGLVDLMQRTKGKTYVTVRVGDRNHDDGRTFEAPGTTIAAIIQANIAEIDKEIVELGGEV